MALVSRRRRIARRTLALARRGFAATGVEDDLVLSTLCCCGVRKLLEEGREKQREKEREREERTSQREGSRRMKGREYLSAGGVRATPSSSFVSAGCRQATY